MNHEQVTAMLSLILTLAIVVTIGVVLWKLELRMIYTLALILITGITLALITAAAALPIRAHKGREPREREIIRERHTIRDGRQEPRIITVNSDRGTGLDRYLFPEVIRGLITSTQRQHPPDKDSSVIVGEVVPDDEWCGPIEG